MNIQLLKEIENDKLINKYKAKYVRLSGCNTYVFPISVFKNEIIVQIDTDKNYFSGLCKRYIEKFNLDTAYFSKSDGSCPSELIFKCKNNDVYTLETKIKYKDSREKVENINRWLRSVLTPKELRTLNNMIERK